MSGAGKPATLEADPLAWILGVDDSADFVARHLGSAWLHARSDARHRFSELLSLAQLDVILGTHAVRRGGVSLVRADQDIPASEYVWRDDMVDPVQVARLFASGATVIFNGLHDRHEGTRKLCAALTRQIGARVQANVYLTPPSSQGFKAHWDTHDVYVIQVEGSKQWRMYTGGPEHPLQDQRFDPARHGPAEVEADFTLRSGEVLYIPRGIMHAAVTTAEASLHITVGVIAYTWADLVTDCLSEIVERAPAWRENVPFGFARVGSNPALLVELHRRLTTLASDTDLEKVVAARQSAFEAFLRPRETDSMRQALSASILGSADVIRWRSGAEARLEPRDNRIALVGFAREVEFPASATRALELLMSGEPIRANHLDDGLDWESRRVVVSTLIREGFVARELRF